MYILPLSFLILSAFLAIVTFILDNNKTEFQKIKVKSKKIKQKDRKQVKVFNFLYSTPLIDILLNRCVKKINNSGKLNSRIKISALKVFLYSLLISLSIGIIISPFINNIRLLISTLIALLFIFFSGIDYFSGRIKNKLLSNLVDFLDILRTKYFETGNRVDEALSESIASLDSQRHEDIIDEAETLLDTLENPDSDLALRDYYQIAPGNYFILLAGLLFITKENGDLIDEKGSRFAKALSDLGSELKDEIKLRDKLNFSLKSLNIISIIPLFLMSPLKMWAGNSFYPMQKFYESSLGFICEFIVLMAVILSFIGISKIQNFKENTINENISMGLNKIYDKHKKIITMFIPIKDGEKYKKISKKKSESLDFTTMEIFYTKKLLFAILAAFISLFVLIYSAQIAKNTILNNPTLPDGYLGGEVNDKYMKEAIARSEMDKKMIMLLKNNTDADKILDSLENEYGLLGKDKEDAINRIIYKYKKYKAAGIDYMAIIKIYIIAILSYFIPNLLLIFRKKMLKIDAMNEISKFQLICLLLMNIKQIRVDTLLEWMERFSAVYKPPIQEAIMDYDSGAEEAIKKLKNQTSNDEFRKILDHILSAVNTVSLNRAFEDLESEKNYYRQRRRTIYERIIDKKVGIGRLVGFVPTYTLILIYFMFPLIHSSMGEMDIYFKMFLG